MPKKIGAKDAKQKAARFCTLRERSPKEANDKLISWGLSKEEAGSILKELLEHGWVDEQRFANAFCHDKFEFNSWGKQKIKARIFPHQLKEEVIEKALLRIDDRAYQSKLADIARKKWASLGREETLKRKQKTFAFLANRGFEPDLIWKTMNVFAP